MFGGAMAGYFDFFIPRFAEKADRERALTSGIVLVRDDADVSEAMTTLRLKVGSCDTLEEGYREAASLVGRNLQYLAEHEVSRGTGRPKEGPGEDFEKTWAALAGTVEALAAELADLNERLDELETIEEPSDSDRTEIERLRAALGRVGTALADAKVAMRRHEELGPVGAADADVVGVLDFVGLLVEAVEVFERAGETEFYRRRAAHFVAARHEEVRDAQESGRLSKVRGYLVDTLCSLAVLRQSARRGLPNLRGYVRAIAALESLVDQMDVNDAGLDFGTASDIMAMPVSIPSWTRNAHPCKCSRGAAHLGQSLLENSPLEEHRTVQNYQKAVEEAEAKGRDDVSEGTTDKKCECECDDSCVPQNPCCVELNSYVMDLMTITETVDRYEAGDLAHIQNKMAGEKITRSHKSLQETERYLELETSQQSFEEHEVGKSERFKLQRAVQKTSQQDLSTDAGITTSGKYGPAGSYNATANVAYSNSRSEAKQTAREYAKEISDRSVSRIQSDSRKLTTQRTLHQVTETNKHKFEAAEVHVSGQYYWLNQITVSQVMNRGRRIHYEFVFPEPALLYKDLVKRANASKTDLPALLDYSDFDASDISEQAGPYGYREIAQRFGLEDVEPPPPPKLFNTFTAQGTAYANTEVDMGTMPAGYLLHRVSTAIANATACSFHIGHWGGIGTSGPVNLPIPADQALSLMIINHGSGIPASGSGSVEFHVTNDAIVGWQNDIYDKVIAASEVRARERALAESEQQAREMPTIKGRNSFLNREVEREHLWRQVVSMLSCQHFDRFNAMKRHVEPCGYPQLDFVEAEQQMAFTQFFEQVYDVQQMMYLFYPSFWGNKCAWPDNIGIDTGDPLFDKFLTAGAARVTVPVNPGMEPLALYYEMTGEIWMGQGTPDYDPTSPHFLAMHKEIRNRSGNFQEDRLGPLDIDFEHNDQAGNPILDANGDPLGHDRSFVAVHGTDYWWDWTAMTIDTVAIAEDMDRAIIIDSRSYRIIDIELDDGEYNGTTNVPTSQIQQYDQTFIKSLRWIITLATPVQDPTCGEPQLSILKWAVGAIYVGATWENVIPTNQVWLRPQTDDGYDNCLPCYPVQC